MIEGIIPGNFYFVIHK